MVFRAAIYSTVDNYAPADFVRMAASGLFPLAAVTSTFPSADLPRAMEEAAATRGSDARSECLDIITSMLKILPLMFLAGLLPAQTPPDKPQTLRQILLEQLHTTHDQEDWYVPIKVAVEGVTPEQANWTDGKGNHSIGQLVNHLAFWDARALEQFKGEKPSAYNGNNEETFNSFDGKTWADTVGKLDRVMKAWEKAVEEADDAKIGASASRIAHVGAHNAYHLGQIVYIRKSQGSWNPANGVK